MSTWRDRFRPLIAEVLRENAGAEPRVVATALVAKWRGMFGRGATKGSGCCWQYHVWRDEIRRQLDQAADYDSTVQRLPRKRVKKPVRRRMTPEEIKQWFAERQLPLIPDDEGETIQ